LLIGLVTILGTARAYCSNVAESLAPNLETFDRELDRYHSLLQPPGLAVGVARGGKLTHFRAFGYADVEKRSPITPDTIFWIASVTKTFTAVALKQFEEEGRISLEDELIRSPNRYFDSRRIGPGVTIGHIISHTSESQPPGSKFVYNGGRYNLAFNVFDAVMPDRADSDAIRPFTRIIEDRILEPLHLDHTVTRVSSKQFEALRSHVVTPYAYDAGVRRYVPVTGPFDFNTSYPATGMLSSIADLVRYSHALTSGKLISRAGYSALTTPFYDGRDGRSPYGQGWFTTTFEGVKLHWAFGYGDADTALLVIIPDRDLTLVMLSNSATPSATTMLGYGNPLNSPIAVSFLKSFVLHDRLLNESIDYAEDIAGN
jgi:CubicO group peptidase (beta-lactamase class C family)